MSTVDGFDTVNKNEIMYAKITLQVSGVEFPDEKI